MHVAFIIHNLGPGGAERVIVHLANGLANRNYQVTIHTLSAQPKLPFYPLDSRVRYIPLGMNHSPKREGTFGALGHVIRLIWNLRRHMENQAYTVLVAFIDMTNIFAILACAGLRLPVVVSERSDPRSAPLRRVWKILRQITYPGADALVVQSAEVRNWFAPWIQRKAFVIPNPVLPPPNMIVPLPISHGPHKVIAVGRLGREKGFDLLLQAFSQLAPYFPDWNLEIWGEGSERINLEDLQRRLGLKERVRFCGTTIDIHTQYAHADLFVLSSKFEGFPNALGEAMSHGLAVVATSCSGGVREILRHNVNGLLVPPEDLNALVNALATFMRDPLLRETLGKKAREVVQRFSLDHVLDSWETCLCKAVENSRRLE